jgi:hypothetical protein
MTAARGSSEGRSCFCLSPSPHAGNCDAKAFQRYPLGQERRGGGKQGTIYASFRMQLELVW